MNVSAVGADTIVSLSVALLLEMFNSTTPLFAVAVAVFEIAPVLDNEIVHVAV